MNNRKPYTILCVICLMMIALIWINKVCCKEEADNYINLESGWNITINGKEYHDITLEDFRFPIAKQGDVIELNQVLPKKKIANASLYMLTIYTEIHIYLDEQEIYCYGSDLRNNGQLLGYGYQLIDLTEDYEGKSIKIRLIVSENQSFSTIKVPKIVDSRVAIQNYASNNKIELAISLFLIVFGIGILAIMMILFYNHIIFYKMICAACFSIGIGIWSICNYGLILIFTNNIVFKTKIEFLSLFMIALLIFMYFFEDVIKRGSFIQKMVYYIILGVQGAFLILSIVLQHLNIRHYPAMLIYQHIIIAAMLVFLIIMFIKDAVKDQMENKIVIFGFFIMIVLVIEDLIRFNVEKYTQITKQENYNSYLFLGMFIFVLSIIFDFLVNFIHSATDAATSKALEEMAYKDEMTGLNNRRYCENYFDRIDEDNSIYTLLTFDLNDLKKVNDCYGHEKGDEYICSFAQILQEVFGRNGMVARMGGDEFVVVLKNKKIHDVLPLLKEFDEKIDSTKALEGRIPISTAYGECTSSENQVHTIRQALKKADSRMYYNKQSMKKNIQSER